MAVVVSMVAVAVAWRCRWWRWRWLSDNRVMMGSTSGHDKEGRGMILFIYFLEAKDLGTPERSLTIVSRSGRSTHREVTSQPQPLTRGVGELELDSREEIELAGSC